MLSTPPSLESILLLAREHEKAYDWLEAAESYKKVLDLGSEPERRAIQENFAHALFQASMQAENQNQFRQRIYRSVEAYLNASELYDKAGDRGRHARCDAMIAYMKHCIAENAVERKKLVEISADHANNALTIFEANDDPLECWKTLWLLSDSQNFAALYQPDNSLGMVKKASEHAESALVLLSNDKDSLQLSLAYGVAAAWMQATMQSSNLDHKERENQLEKIKSYWSHAKEISEDGFLQLSAAGASNFFGIGSEAAVAFCRKAVDYWKRTGNRFLTGRALEDLAAHICWRGLAQEDPAIHIRLLSDSLAFTEQAILEYSALPFAYPLAPTMNGTEPRVEYYWQLALLETDPSTKISLLQKSTDLAPRLLEKAEESGFPSVISTAHHAISKVFQYRAKFETVKENRKSLLEKALKHRIESIRIDDRISPYEYWSRGLFADYLANIRYDLSIVEQDADVKRRLLEEAITTKAAALDYWSKITSDLKDSPTLFVRVGEAYLRQGDQLSSLYEISNDADALKKAVGSYHRASQLFGQLGFASRVAESHWRAGQVYDGLGEYVNASREFNLASEGYAQASEKIPQLRDFYNGHATYMEAWTNIQNAKHEHVKQEYDLASKSYDQAAKLHRSSSQWKFLAPNYSAWAEVELAEELSKNEKSEDAVKAFERAARLFQDGKKSISQELGRIERFDEKQMVLGLVKVADLREEYCRARIIVEEAKLLDRNGDHHSSSEKYGLAVDHFEKISQRMPSDQAQRELQLIITLSKAWQAMTRAEAEASPELYLEASKLFEEAKKLSPAEKSKILALGHSRFCKALEAGAKFVESRDRTMHETAIQNLEAAATFYGKAGFDHASEYSKASKLLFDAYVFMDDANKERDHAKKTKFYVMAEKVLEASADSFAKAEYPGKKEEVMRLLKRVKEDREMARSLSEVFNAPSIVSATTSFTSPTPTFEKPVGLERFEHADVQANLIARSRELTVGEHLDLEIELVNAGRGPAQLIKIEEIMLDGFETMGETGSYRIEDNYLNMKGKQLPALKTEEVRLVLKSKARGQFVFKPRILYIDDSGKYKSHEPEPLQLTVRELGISGWVRGH